MDREGWVREVATVQEPARLRALLEESGEHLDLELAAVLKERIDDINRDDPRLALALAEEALAASGRCTNPLVRAWMLWARAHAQMQLEEYQAGLTSCEAALEIFQSAGEEHTAAQVQVSRLFALVNLSREEEAIRTAESIRPILEAHNDAYTLARLDMNVGIAYDDTDRHEQALRCFEAAARRYEAVGRPLEVIRARINMAVALENLDRYDDALRVYREIRPALADLGKRMELARLDMDMAVLHFWQGEYALALERFEAARRAFQELDVPAEMDQVDLYRAMLFLELNLFTEVIEACNAVEERAGERGITRDVVLARRFAALARGYRRWPGDWDAALDLLRQVRAVAVARGTTLQALQIDLDIALLLLEGGLAEQALTLAQAAAGGLEAYPSKRARADLLCGRCALALGDIDSAQHHLLAALQVAQRQSLPQIAFRCHHGLGRIAETRGQLQEAREHYEQAIGYIERLRQRVLVDDFRASFLKDKLQVYADAVRLCLKEGDLDAAFGYIEQAKARVLLDLILFSGPSVEMTEPEATALYERLRELERRWNALQSRPLPDPRSQGDRGDLMAIIPERWQEDISELERKMVALRQQLQMLKSARTSFTGEAVTTLQNFQKQIPDRATLLEYFAYDGHMVVLVVSKHHCQPWPLEKSPEQLARLTRELLTDLQAYHPGWAGSVNRRLHTLYDDLIAPVRSLLNTPWLIVIPHGPLYHVPFAALYEEGHPLVESFEISYAPSATVYALCAQRRSGATQDVLLAFSDAGRIPGTREEVARISREFPGAIVLDEEEATLELLSRHCGRARILHLAAHGRFRADNPLFSSLRLADADLTVGQVYGLRLSASLVTLSACESGLSHLEGNDMIGLTTAFLYAGTASLVVSLWHASDESTARLMEAFYRNLSQGQRKSAALRVAQLELLGTRKFSAPFYWAPFVLYGDTSPLPIVPGEEEKR